MSKLTPHDVVGNCRIAFDAAETLGIPRVIEPLDMSMLAVPDKLAVMTYLYQLRAHFTGHQLQLEQLGSTSDESSYVIGNYKSDNQLAPMKLERLKMNLSAHHPHHQYITALDEETTAGSRSPTEKKDVKNLILSGSRNLLGRVLSPTKDKAVTEAVVVAGQAQVAPPVAKPALMTRRELTDPFGSDEEDETSNGKEVNGCAVTTSSVPVVKETTVTSPTLDPATTNVSSVVGDMDMFVSAG